MNGSLPALDASLAYSGAGEDLFDFDLFDALARESSPPSLTSGDQVTTPPPPPRPPRRRSWYSIALFGAPHHSALHDNALHQ